MKRNIKNCIISVIATVLLCITVSCLFGVNVQTKKCGTSRSVQQNDKEVKEYLKNKYKKKNNVVVTFGSLKKLDSKNFNQTKIKNYYNKSVSKSKKITSSSSEGVCWSAAMTSLLKYNGVKESGSKVGSKAISKAMDKKWIKYDDTGLWFSRHDALLNLLLKEYSIKNLKANNDRNMIFKTLKKEINDKRVVLFSVKDHTMCGCGYATYHVRYKKMGLFGVTKIVNKIEDFVIVNDTWSDNHQYSFYPECEIRTNPFGKWEFGITKLK